MIDYATVELMGTFLQVDRTPATGFVTVTPSRKVIIGGQAIMTGAAKIPLDKAGKFSIGLPATDDPTLGEGFSYGVVAAMEHAYWRADEVELPAAAGVVDLSAVPADQSVEYPSRAEWGALVDASLTQVAVDATRAENAADLAQGAVVQVATDATRAEVATAAATDASASASDSATSASTDAGVATVAATDAVNARDEAASSAVDARASAGAADASATAAGDSAGTASAAASTATTAATDAVGARDEALSVVEAASTLLEQMGDVAGTLDLSGIGKNALVHFKLTGDITDTLLPASPIPGRTITLVAQQDAVGGRGLRLPGVAIAWGASTDVVLSLSPNAVDQIHLLFDGIRWVGLVAAQNLSIPGGWTV